MCAVCVSFFPSSAVGAPPGGGGGGVALNVRVDEESTDGLVKGKLAALLALCSVVLQVCWFGLAFVSCAMMCCIEHWSALMIQHASSQEELHRGRLSVRAHSKSCAQTHRIPRCTPD